MLNRIGKACTLHSVFNGHLRPAFDGLGCCDSRLLKLQTVKASRPGSAKLQLISSIGLIMPDLQNMFLTSVASGIKHFARQNDMLMVLGTTGSEIQWEEYYAQSLRNRRLDGVILLSGSGKPTAGLIKLVASGSVVFVDECVP